MIKIFDLGSYNLIPLEEFLIYKGYKNEEICVFCFEPDIDQYESYLIYEEYLKKEYSNLSLIFSQKVIYSKVGQVDYLKGIPLDSSSIIKTKVDTVDINSVLGNNIKETDFVSIRMDIEGCEFNALARILENDKLCEMIDEIYLEWHDFFWHKNLRWWKSSTVTSVLPSDMLLDRKRYLKTHFIEYDLRQSLKKIYYREFKRYNIELQDLTKIEGIDPNDRDIRKEIVKRRNRFLEEKQR